MRLFEKLVVLSLLPLAGLFGCGAKPKETLVPVAGTLQVDGKPMGGVLISLIPANGKVGAGGTALTQDSGAFTVMHTLQNEPGLAVGDYIVSYSKLVMPDGSPLPKGNAAGKDRAPPGLSDAKQFFPSQLVFPKNESQQTKVSIPQGGNSKLELKVDLKAAGGARR